MNLQEFIKAAKEQRAQEIVFAPQRPVQLRVGRDLFPANQKEITAAESRALVLQILSEEEKKKLFQDLSISGIKHIGNIDFKFDFHVDFAGVSGALQLDADTKTNWTLPQNLSESLMRPQGLHVLTGPRRSGKSAAIAELLQAAKSKNKNIVCYVDSESQLLAKSSTPLSQFPISSLSVATIPRSADLIVIDSLEIAHCEVALRLAEMGYNVLLSLPFWNIEMALERLMDLCGGSEASRARRVASVLQWIVGLQLVPGIENTFCGAFEMLSVNSDVQKILSHQQMHQLKTVMDDRNDKLGMRTMNQSLFQLLIKRKIELKFAFEFSPAPEELDRLLKKVGI